MHRYRPRRKAEVPLMRGLGMGIFCDGGQACALIAQTTFELKWRIYGAFRTCRNGSSLCEISICMVRHLYAKLCLHFARFAPRLA